MSNHELTDFRPSVYAQSPELVDSVLLLMARKSQVDGGEPFHYKDSPESSLYVLGRNSPYFVGVQVSKIESGKWEYAYHFELSSVSWADSDMLCFVAVMNRKRDLLLINPDIE